MSAIGVRATAGERHPQIVRVDLRNSVGSDAQPDRRTGQRASRAHVRGLAEESGQEERVPRAPGEELAAASLEAVLRRAQLRPPNATTAPRLSRWTLGQRSRAAFTSRTGRSVRAASCSSFTGSPLTSSRKSARASGASSAAGKVPASADPSAASPLGSFTLRSTRACRGHASASVIPAEAMVGLVKVMRGRAE
jgi:hypothetical protein